MIRMRDRVDTVDLKVQLIGLMRVIVCECCRKGCCRGEKVGRVRKLVVYKLGSCLGGVKWVNCKSKRQGRVSCIKMTYSYIMIFVSRSRPGQHQWRDSCDLCDLPELSRKLVGKVSRLLALPPTSTSKNSHSPRTGHTGRVQTVPAAAALSTWKDPCLSPAGA